MLDISRIRVNINMYWNTTHGDVYIYERKGYKSNKFVSLPNIYIKPNQVTICDKSKSKLTNSYNNFAVLLYIWSLSMRKIIL